MDFGLTPYSSKSQKVYSSGNSQNLPLDVKEAQKFKASPEVRSLLALLPKIPSAFDKEQAVFIEKLCLKLNTLLKTS